MHALLAQLAAAPHDVGRNAARVVEALEHYPNADLAVFPELFLCGYALEEPMRGARRPDAPELQLIADAAARNGTAVIVGFAEEMDGGIANAAACFDETGGLAGVYRKTQLFGAEREFFIPGDELLVVSLAGRQIGVLICFDIEFPEPARQLALADADLLVTVSANMEPYFSVHELASRARALDNRLPHAYVNLVGTFEALEFVGGTRSIGPDGEVLAEAEPRREQLLMAPIPQPGRPLDENLDYLSLTRAPLEVSTH